MKHQQLIRGNSKTASFARTLLNCTLIIIVVLMLNQNVNTVSSQTPGHRIYLPNISDGAPYNGSPVINAPFFDVGSVIDDRYDEMAVVWFGKVTLNDNAGDIRAGYNRQRLYLQLSIFDRQLWYDENPSPANFAKWDSASVYLTFEDTSRSIIRQIRLDAQLSHWETRGAFQAAFEKINGRWTQTSIPFVSKTIWRGEGMNGAAEDRGWIVTYEIPFTSLGSTVPPSNGTQWMMGLVVHDQDTGAGGTVRTSVWPAAFAESTHGSFGRLNFGRPAYTPPAGSVAGTVKILQGSGVRVEDGTVGGYSTCGAGMNFWTQWGNRVYNSNPENQVAVIQNQGDVADWPCFARYYVTFPINAVPRGKVILSAKLTMHQFGNSDPANAQPSYIQVFRVGDEWHEETLSWNTAPQALENYPGTWVSALATYPGVPGVARTWDVSHAMANAYNNQQPLRLALYAADFDYHSGKYFHSSETASWSNVTPPTLTIQWANP